MTIHTGQVCIEMKFTENEPEGVFAGFGATVTAVSDFFVKLASRECYAIVIGRAFSGLTAVWRYPVMIPSDIEVWTAKIPPFSLEYLPDNCIIVSRKGTGICELGAPTSSWKSC